VKEGDRKMTAGERDESPLGAPDEVAAQAAEEILGPNPFVGLRPQDVLAAAGGNPTES
jgi:polyhydroxyalkanoate synthase